MSTASPSPRPNRPPVRGTPISNSTASTASHVSARGTVRPPPASSRSSAGVSPLPRRSSVRSPPPRPVSGGGSPDRPSSRNSLSASLARETEEKEALLVKIQERDSTIAMINNENTNLNSTLATAEARLIELYAEQSRMEDELATRHDVSDKLRAQIRELEKEKRDVQRRYNEQSQTFDAERQAFYDNEQHLKSRIQSLTQSRKPQHARRPSLAATSETSDANEEGEEVNDDLGQPEPEEDISTHEEELEAPETTALKLELSTLATSYSSLQNTLQLLQTQLTEVQRVNKELQEENESYNILLVERTINGQYDILRRTAPTPSTWHGDDDDMSSLHDTMHSNLDVVSEIEEHRNPSMELELAMAQPRPLSPDSHRTGGRKTSRRNGSTRASSPGRGETLADLPVAGPGLDLAAELGRAENKDMLDGYPDGPSEPQAPPQVDFKVVEALRSEVKSLKDANKALNLYASKILDRIIAQDGFENILAVDYKPRSHGNPQALITPGPTKTRTQSMSLLRAPSEAQPSVSSSTSDVSSNKDPEKRTRRGLSIDWGRIWPSSATPSPQPGNSGSPIPPQNLPTATGTARKLDFPEDEEDRKLRARLAAEMRLHGIEKEAPPEPPSLIPPTPTSPRTTPTPSLKARLPFFSRSPSSSTSGDSLLPPGPNPLTSAALEQSEVVTNIAALDAREKELAEEIGKGRPGGFTELEPRPGSSLSERHRSRRSGDSHSVKSGASTLWSAGRMSMEGSLGEVEENEGRRDN